MADLLTGDELWRLFGTFKRGAFRLETRDRYNVPDEQESQRRFFAGDPDEDYLYGSNPWFDMTNRAAAEGRPVRRVRVVTLPLGDYSRYALWSAQGNLSAGEDIRYLDRGSASDLGLPVAPPHDAWMFDDERVAVLRFDEDDVLLGIELTDDEAVAAQHRAWQDTAWQHALSREAFLRSHPGA